MTKPAALAASRIAKAKDNYLKPIRIGLLWHSLRAGNLGVGALTLGNIAILREIAEAGGWPVEFVVLSMRESSTAPIADGIAQYEIDTKRLFSPSGFAREVSTLDCVLDIGAGDSFADIYGFKRFVFLWYTKWLSVRAGKPLVLAPQTIGPFTRQPYKTMAAWIMERASAVVARDEKSLGVVRELAPRADAHRAVDVAFKLPFENRKIAENHGRKLRVGINASGLLCKQAESGQNRFGLSYDYLELHRKLIGHFSEQPDCEVHLVTHANSLGDAGDDDGTWADRLAAEFPDTIRVPDFKGPGEAKSYISGLDFLVAGRMHACIAAFSSATPVVPVSYSRKFSGLFDLLGYPFYTPMADISAAEMFDRIIDDFSKRAEMAQAETEALAKVEAMFEPYHQVMSRIFSEIETSRK